MMLTRKKTIAAIADHIAKAWSNTLRKGTRASSSASPVCGRASGDGGRPLPRPPTLSPIPPDCAVQTCRRARTARGPKNYRKVGRLAMCAQTAKWEGSAQSRRPCTDKPPTAVCNDAQNGPCAPAMDSITSTSRASAVPRRRRLPSKLRRRLLGALMLAIGLFATGALYLVLAPRPQVANAETATQTDPAQIAHGEQLYNNACITCHGTHL